MFFPLRRRLPALPPIWPHICLLCGNRGHEARDLCCHCEADLPWNDTACHTCGLPLFIEHMSPDNDNTGNFLCGECQQSPSPFKVVVTPLHYQAEVAVLLRRFKHQQQLTSGKILAQVLSQQIHDTYLDLSHENISLPQALIPIPLHWRRFLQRGYNQSTELAKLLSKSLSITCLTKHVRRTRHTNSQQGLDKKQRRANVHQAFALKKTVPFQRVAIVDDVVTTGSTATEVATLLHRSGVEEVHLWAVARTSLTTH